MLGSLHRRLQERAGAQKAVPGAGAAPPQPPLLTSYCLRRLLTFSSFLATAVFTLSRGMERG